MKPCDARRAAHLRRSGRRLTETRAAAEACSPRHSCFVLFRQGRCLMLSMQQSTKSAGYGNARGGNLLQNASLTLKRASLVAREK